MVTPTTKQFSIWLDFYAHIHASTEPKTLKSGHKLSSPEYYESVKANKDHPLHERLRIFDAFRETLQKGDMFVGDNAHVRCVRRGRDFKIRTPK